MRGRLKVVEKRWEKQEKSDRTMSEISIIEKAPLQRVRNFNKTKLFDEGIPRSSQTPHNIYCLSDHKQHLSTFFLARTSEIVQSCRNLFLNDIDLKTMF
jgi:hypothetical protein